MVVADKHQLAVLSVVLGSEDGVYVRVGTKASKPMMGKDSAQHMQ